MLALLMPGIAAVAALLGVLLICRFVLRFASSLVEVLGGGLSDSADVLG